MSKKKRKNSNYVTEKTRLAMAKRERAEKNNKTKKALLITALVLVIIGLIAIGFGVASAIKANRRTVTFVVDGDIYHTATVEKGETVPLPENPTKEGCTFTGWLMNGKSFNASTAKINENVMVAATWDKQPDKIKATHHVTIEIKNYGTMHVELYGEEAPITVANFIRLVNKGYYDGLKLHRIISGFMMQGGDGKDTDSIYGEFESNGFDNRVKHERGAISMARTGIPNSASNQFFIVHRTKGAEHLDGDYAAFGKVTSGIEVVDQICADAQPYDNNGSIYESEQPVIKSITVHPVH